MTGRGARSWASFALALSLVLACARVPTPEERIQAMLEQGQQAVARRDTAALAGFIAESYRDGRGLDRAGMLGWLESVFGSLGPLAIYVKPIAIEVTGAGRARVTLLVATAARSRDAEGWLDGLDADARRVELRLIDESGTWQVTSAEY